MIKSISGYKGKKRGDAGESEVAWELMENFETSFAMDQVPEQCREAHVVSIQERQWK